MKIFKNGLMTGLLLQLALGPVFFFIINLTLQRTILDGLIAVIAVTIVDYIYITLAILGIGSLLKKKKVRKYLGSLVQLFSSFSVEQSSKMSSVVILPLT